MTQSDTLQNTTTQSITNPIDALILMVANRFGSKSKEVERFIKFGIVGFIGAVVDFGTVFILQETLFPPISELNVAVATSIAFFAAVTSNFIWNRYWTYPDSRSRSIRRQLTQFTVVNMISWAGRTVWVTLSHNWLGRLAMPTFVVVWTMIHPEYVPDAESEAQVGTFVALLIGVVVAMIWNFFVNRYWTYGDVDQVDQADVDANRA